MIRLIRDLSEEIMDLKRQIVKTKASPMRVKMGVKMNEKNRLLIRSTIRLAKPGISEREISAKYFELYHGHEFSTSQKKTITDGILSYQPK